MDEIIIQKINEKLQIIVLEKGKIVELYEYDENNIPKLGNVYIGQINDVVPSMNTLFVDIGFEKAGYLQLDNFDKKYKNGEKILVQIKKDETYSKGAKLSDKLSISGKYVVLLLNSNIVTCSRKIIEDKKESLISCVKSVLPDNIGAIIRTEAENIDESIVTNEIKELLKKIDKINEKIQEDEVGLIYDASSIENKILFDMIKSTTKKIYINDESIYNMLLMAIEDYKKDGLISHIPEISYSNTNYVDEFGLLSEYENVFDRKIWLKSSGYIAVDKTEALTAIDVNTGKFLGKNEQEKEEIAFETNKEAVYEVAKQIRLKNLGGIIVVDFINMEEISHKDEILRILEEKVKKDRSRVEVYGFTRLGLVEIARKRI